MKTFLFGAVAAALLFSVGQPAAQADEAKDETGFYALIGASGANPEASGVSSDTEGSVALGYAFSPHWAAELGSPIRAYRHSLSDGDLGRVATFHARPLEASVLYHFTPDSRFQPYVGVGYAWTRYTDERARGFASGLPVSLDNDRGALGRVGLDYNFGFSDRWLARADVTYLDLNPRGHVDGFPTGSLDGDTWKYGLQVGYRF